MSEPFVECVRECVDYFLAALTAAASVAVAIVIPGCAIALSLWLIRLVLGW